MRGTTRRGTTRRGTRELTVGVLLAAVAVAVPNAGCAEQPRVAAVVLKGHPAQVVTFRPAYGDLPVTAVSERPR